MYTKHGWINIYQSGYWHPAGKPGAFNRHAGDIYPSLAEAIANIDPVSHYVDTVNVVWNDKHDVKVNEVP